MYFWYVYSHPGKWFGRVASIPPEGVSPDEGKNHRSPIYEVDSWDVDAATKKFPPPKEPPKE